MTQRGEVWRKVRGCWNDACIKTHHVRLTDGAGGLHKRRKRQAEIEGIEEQPAHRRCISFDRGRASRQKTGWNRDRFRLTHGEEGVAWIGDSTQDGNLVAQLETVFSVAPGILRKDGGIDVRVGNDVGGEGAIAIIGAVQKRLDGALCETVEERENKESYGDPVQSDPQVLESGRSEREKRVGLLGGHTMTHDGFYSGPYPTGSKHVGGN